MAQGRPLTLADVEVVGLCVRESFAGDVLTDVFTETFQRVGIPDALVIDGGTDIRKAAYSVNERLQTRIAIIDDITHFCGRLLKNGLAPASDLVDAFTQDSARCAAQVRQTEFAHLAPPALRHKARYLNLSKVAAWGSRILSLLNETERGRPTADQSRALGFFSWLRNHVPLIDALVTSTSSLNRVMSILKHRGLSIDTALEVKMECGSLGHKSHISIALHRWIELYLPLLSRLGTILCTTDIIESLFSRWKSVMGYHRNSEVNSLVLLLPALCGKLTQEQVTQALTEVKEGDVQAWLQREIGTTLRMRRHKLRRAMGTRKRRGQKTAGNPFLKRA